MPALSILDCAGIFLFCVRIFRISEKLAEIESFLPKCRQADHKSAKILAFHKAVVAALILYLQDAGRLHAHIIQRVALGVHAEQVSVLVLMAAAQGHLHTDGGIIAVIEIAEAFKDIPLVVRPRQTVVDVLIGYGLGEKPVVQPAQAVRVQVPKRDAVLHGICLLYTSDAADD